MQSTMPLSDRPLHRLSRRTPDPLLLSVPAALFVLFGRLGTLQGEDPPAVDWQPYFRSLARSYQITPKSQPDKPFTLLEPPVLRWSQPVRGGDDGAVYLWLSDGVPAAIGTMFCWPHQDGDRVVVNEFHSFLTEPLTAARDGQPAWTPETGGIEWKDLAEAPAPASGAAQRLFQMRRLTQRFRGENSDDQPGGKNWELRLLPNPLYRYQLPESKTGGELIDGALFTLASGTDPEVLILLEARKTVDGESWRYALARFSDRPLSVWLDDNQIWSVPRARPSRSTPHTYFDVDRLKQPPAATGVESP